MGRAGSSSSQVGQLNPSLLRMRSFLSEPVQLDQIAQIEKCFETLQDAFLKQKLKLQTVPGISKVKSYPEF